MTDGCAGNLLDRLPDGRGTDFVALGRLPVFNLADVFILVGFAVMVGSSVVVDLHDELEVVRPRRARSGMPEVDHVRGVLR